MITTWRICHPKFAKSTQTGEGAALAGGRWNVKGQKVVYTSESLSLSAMETIAHADSGLLDVYRTVSFQFDDGLVETLDSTKLPPDWRSLFEPDWLPLQLLGDEWLKSGRSAVLKVPSAVSPRESNYLLNPAHPNFAKIVIGKPEPYKTDERILTRVGRA